MSDLESINIELSPEERLKLRGRIDRVDTCEDGEHVYVKVIDYKSGNTSFQLLSLYHGLQLQLVIYLNAAMELMKKNIPIRRYFRRAFCIISSRIRCWIQTGRKRT